MPSSPCSQSSTTEDLNLSFTSIDTSTTQARTENGRFAFGSRRAKKPDVALLPQPNAALDSIFDLSDNASTTRADKLHRAAALYAKWKYEDEEEPVEGDELISQQRQQCEDIGLIVFGFVLHEEQIDAIYCLYYESTDLLLLAKTGFGKSLIFQLLPFMTPIPGVVLILIPLKLLQAEQCLSINSIPNGKGLVLNGENNQKKVLQDVARGGYTHIFTSPEITLSKKFKQNILDNYRFTDRLCLMAIDEIHLVDEWGQAFRPMYAEIEKVRKRIPGHIPLLGVSATLTKKTRLQVLDKTSFLPNYRLMQTSLDRPEIMQIHRFMEHTKASGLEFQFILPKTAKEARDIQKTIIFVNTVKEIRVLIEVIKGWMIKLGYPPESSTWIRPYYSDMSEWDKNFTAKAFLTPGDSNFECTILVATDVYGLGIDNLDIKLVIQWDISITFDAMIQRLGRAGRKGGLSTFVLITPKWCQVKDPDEIENRVSKTTTAVNNHSRLSDTNCPKRKSPLTQVSLPQPTNISDNGSVVESDAEEEDLEHRTINDQDLLLAVLATEVETEKQSRSAKNRANKSDLQKWANLPNEIFDYIHVAPCRRLFSLA